MNYEVAIGMQRICTGETAELTRGGIAEEVIDINKIIEGMNEENAGKCRAFYEKLIEDDTKKMYDADSLVEETDTLKKEMDDFVASNVKMDILCRIFNGIDDFFMNAPFGGLDSIEYGVNEVCVFSVTEYFIWKTDAGHDHEKCRNEYRNDIAKRTYEEVADHWIGVYDDLQKRYDKICRQCQEGSSEDDPSLSANLKDMIAGCCIVAVSAIRDQDDFALDMVQSRAAQKGHAISEDYENGKYEEGGSVFTDNVMRLYRFICGFLEI